MRVFVLLLFLVVFVESNAQFLKKLQDKVNSKIDQKVNQKVDEAFDKDYTKKSKSSKSTESDLPEKENKNNATGKVSIKQSNGKTLEIGKFGKVKITREGSEIWIGGSWFTQSADIYDGFSIKLSHQNFSNSSDISDFPTGSYTVYKDENQVNGKSYACWMNMGYDPEKTKSTPSKNYQNFLLKNGTVVIKSISEEGVSFSFSGATYAPEGAINNPIASVSGNASFQNIIVKEPKVSTKSSNSNGSNSSSYSMPNFGGDKSIEIRDEYVFSIQVVHKATSISKEGKSYKQKYTYLYNLDKPYSGMKISMDDQDVEGNTYVVMEEGKSITFVNTSSMKMCTVSENKGLNQKIETPKMENLDRLKKTGNTKTIIGHQCEEYTIDDESGNEYVFWIAPSLDIPNLGEQFTSQESPIEGHILEYDIKTDDGSINMKAVSIDRNKKLTIKSSDYKRF